MRAIAELRAKLLALTQVKPFRVEVDTLPDQHSGLGTKTALLLSVILGTARLFNVPLSNEDMQRLSGRGGASGVGIHSFFLGGVIWDGGHPQASVRELLPSSAHVPSSVPPCMARLRFPNAWRVCLVRAAGNHPSGEIEREIFRRATPLPRQETLELLAWVTHGLIPAFADECLPALASSLRMISTLGFKARELASQREEVRALLTQFQSSGIAAGMSSLGPTVFAITDASDADAASLVERMATSVGAVFQWTRGQNCGAQAGEPA
jgi:beta-ribofuranosylaminobenzene 5'-phosphate synthase